jgi:integral membrane protein (TIGR01906 family)
MRGLLRWLLVLAVPVVLTMTVVRLLTMGWYPAFEYARPGFPDDPFGLPAEARLELAQATIRFLNLPGRSDILDDLRLPDGSAAYNARELDHMDDVKVVYDGLTLFAAALLVGAAAAAVALVRRGARCVVWTALAQGGVLTLGILLSLAVWMVVGFDAFFTAFHGLFFQSGTWVFAYSDTLIRLFLLPFWQDAGLIVAGTVSLPAVGLVVGGWWGHRRCQLREKGDTV